MPTHMVKSSLQMRKSDAADNFIDWMLMFQDQATAANGFKEDVPLDTALVERLYDSDYTVDRAISEYLVQDSRMK